MDYYKQQFSKYLSQLTKEIELYKTEEGLWHIVEGINNAPGTLALHLCGNLKHNFGAVIGKTGYIRNRDLEFSARDVSREKILEEIKSASDMVIPVIDKLTIDDMKKPFEEVSHGEEQTLGDAIVRLALHFAYHLGQINYHRRILGL
jgi:hypothetical protein